MGLRDASASKNDQKDINMILTTQTIYWMKWIYPAWPPSQFRSKTRRVLMWDTAFGNIWKETHLSWPATSVKSFEPSSLPRAPAYYKNRCYHCPVLHLWKLVCPACVSSNISVTPNDSNGGQLCDVLGCLSTTGWRYVGRRRYKFPTTAPVTRQKQQLSAALLCKCSLQIISTSKTDRQLRAT